jgi:hypothetical protein
MKMTEIEKLRKDFLNVLQTEDIAFLVAAKEIGITHHTFLDFVKNRRTINLKTTWKIENWILKKQKV